MRTRKPPAPGTSWRLRFVHPSRSRTISHDVSSTKGRLRGLVLDEVVLDGWLHLEQMDENVWWIRINDKMTFVSLDESGRATVGKLEESG
jgi:hypothetical protein